MYYPHFRDKKTEVLRELGFLRSHKQLVKEPNPLTLSNVLTRPVACFVIISSTEATNHKMDSGLAWILLQR